MKSKKGISPLIATVLLIGFTIVLAALVMRWGGQFFRQQTDVVGCESEGQIRCTSGVDLEIREALAGSGIVTVNVLNNGNYPIDAIQYIAIDEFGETQKSDKNETDVIALGGSSHDLAVTNGINITTIKVVPILDYEMKDGSSSCVVYCSETIKSVDVTPA